MPTVVSITSFLDRPLRRGLCLVALCSFLILGCSPLHADFTIEDVIDRNPLEIGTGATLRLSKFGSNAVVAMSAFVSLRNAQGTIDALLPAINRRLTCDNGHPIQAELRELRLNSEQGRLSVRAAAHVVDCKVGALEGDVSVIIPLELAATLTAIRLIARRPIVQSEGVYLVVFPLPDGVIRRSAARIEPELAKIVDTLNATLQRQFAHDAVARYRRLFRLRIETAQTDFDGSNLTINLKLSGQAPIVAVNSLFIQ